MFIMKDKNLPDDIKNKSLTELTKLADNLVAYLEKKDLKSNLEDYQKLSILNNLIQKKFHAASKEISEKTRDKIEKIYKNEKRNQ